MTLFTAKQIKKFTIGKKLDISTTLSNYLILEFHYSMDRINAAAQAYKADLKMSSLDRKVEWLCQEVIKVGNQTEIETMMIGFENRYYAA